MAYILAWVADGYGLHLLMILLRDCFVHNTEHPCLMYRLVLLTVMVVFANDILGRLLFV